MRKFLFILLFGLILLILLPTLILKILETRLRPANKILQPAQEKMISSAVTYDCQVKVVTDKREFSLPTNLSSGSFKCYQFVLSAVSPSGNFLAHQDLSGGVDSMVKIYSLAVNQSLQLDVLGTSQIKDMLFDKDDRLIVLNGYEKEMSFRVYDIPGLFGGYPTNVDTRYNTFKGPDFLKYTKTHSLPQGEDYNFMTVDETKLYIYGPAGLAEEPALEFLLEDL